MGRKIIHCDADCFYAAIEMRDNPDLSHRPMAVGGSSSRRGVISTCNYEARKYGIHSAMASAHAMKLCPDLTIVPHSMEKYKSASTAMREIFHHYTDLIEPLSLDEAYLDVSESHACGGSATLIAEEIRQRIHQTLHITVSAGVSNSKFLAKVASDWRKPNGIFVIPPENVETFVKNLPVNKIHGVGKVTDGRLKRMGIDTCGDLRKHSPLELTKHFGAFGPRLFALAHGIDDREVKSARARKSLSVEHTYAEDLPHQASCMQKIPELFVELKSRLHRLNGDDKVAKAFVKVKFNDFSATTLERCGTQARISDYQTLIREAVQRKTNPVRLLGIGVRFFSSETDSAPQQFDLFKA